MWLLLFISHYLIRYESSRGHKIDGTRPNQTGNMFGGKKQRKSRQKVTDKKVPSKDHRRQKGTPKREKIKSKHTTRKKTRTKEKTEETHTGQPRDIYFNKLVSYLLYCQTVCTVVVVPTDDVADECGSRLNAFCTRTLLLVLLVRVSLNLLIRTVQYYPSKSVLPLYLRLEFYMDEFAVVPIRTKVFCCGLYFLSSCAIFFPVHRTTSKRKQESANELE